MVPFFLSLSSPVLLITFSTMNWTIFIFGIIHNYVCYHSMDIVYWNLIIFFFFFLIRFFWYFFLSFSWLFLHVLQPNEITTNGWSKIEIGKGGSIVLVWDVWYLISKMRWHMTWNNNEHRRHYSSFVMFINEIVHLIAYCQLIAFSQISNPM